MLKVNNIKIRTRSKICSKFTVTSRVFIVNFEHISHLVLVFLFLTLNMYLSAGIGTAEGYLEPRQTFKMELFVNNVNGF